MNARGWLVARWTLTLVVVIGLGIDAFVHFDLASDFAQNRTRALSEADLWVFRHECGCR